MIFAILSMCCGVMMSCSLKMARAGQHQRQHHGESAEDGAGDEVGREDGGVPRRQTEVAKSKETTLCTESTSGVERPANSRYAIS
jgi:hypothetical protein